MSFDLRPYLKFGAVPWQVDQWKEGDPNAWNNCVPTSLYLGLASLHYPVPDPEVLTDEVYGRGYVGGEDFATDWTRAVQDFGIDFGYQTIVRDLGFLDAFGRARCYIIGFWYCDANATITLGPGGFYHASPVVYHSDERDQWIVLNVHDGSLVSFTTGELLQANASGYAVFDEPFPDLAPKSIRTEDDDMYRDLSPGEVWPVAVAPDTNFNLTSESGTLVNVLGYQPDGTPIADAKDYNVLGNGANSGKGPAQADGSAAELGIVAPGGTLRFHNKGATKATLWLHREPLPPAPTPGS